MNLDPHDARLTAHILGELPLREAQEVEEAIWANPDIKAEADALQALSEDLVFTFAAEDLPLLTDQQRRSILSGRPSQPIGVAPRFTVPAVAPTVRLTPSLPGARRRSSGLGVWAKAAAVLTFLVGGSLFVRHRWNPQLTITSASESRSTDSSEVIVGLPHLSADDLTIEPDRLVALLERESVKPTVPKPQLSPWPTVSLDGTVRSTAGSTFLAGPDPKQMAAPPFKRLALPETGSHLTVPRESLPPVHSTAASAVASTTGRATLPSYLTQPGDAQILEAASDQESGLQLKKKSDKGHTGSTLAGSSSDTRDFMVAALRRFTAAAPNPLLDAEVAPTSVVPLFSGSGFYSVLRQCVQGFNLRPPRGVVRLEELVNYFDYTLKPTDEAVAVATDAAICPWDESRTLVRVSVQGREVPLTQLPPVRMTFLIHTDDSPENARAHILLWQGMNALMEKMRPEDSVSVVVWGRAQGIVLPPAPGARHDLIQKALSTLSEGGPASAEVGFGQAASVARLQANYGPGINRLIVITDGPLDPAWKGAATALSKEQIAISAVQLGPLHPQWSPTVLGKSATSYQIDSSAEACRLFSREWLAPLGPVAVDTQVAVQFNPRLVRSWRLLGWDNRLGSTAAGAIPGTSGRTLRAGQQSTAVYEVVPVASASVAVMNDARRNPGSDDGAARTSRLLSVDVEYREPGPSQNGSTMRHRHVLGGEIPSWTAASPDFRSAVAGAALGLLLQLERPSASRLSPTLVRQLITPTLLQDRYGLRQEFAGLLDDLEKAASP